MRRKTTRSNFTKGSDRLDSWLALSQNSLIAKLERAIDNANELSPGLEVDIAEIFALFENMTVEERQVGFMIHGMKRWRSVTLRIMAPLYYQESNFSLTKKEQDEVARVLGALEPEEEKRFRKAHFVSDKIGFGDTRLEVDGTVAESSILYVTRWWACNDSYCLYMGSRIFGFIICQTFNFQHSN